MPLDLYLQRGSLVRGRHSLRITLRSRAVRLRIVPAIGGEDQEDKTDRHAGQ